MSGMNGVRAAAINSRQLGYKLIVLAGVLCFVSSVYDLWPAIWLAPLAVAFYSFGRSQGLAEARTMQQQHDHGLLEI